MESESGSKDVVDPEVRAHVSSLLNALGGVGANEDGSYVLGDDGLACLRDLKRWLKLYDQKADRMDVARVLAESNTVDGDLLPILASWQENAENKYKEKVALACFELLVPMTWPIDTKGEKTVNHHRHIPYLIPAQIRYKKAIINFDRARILHTAMRVALPALSEHLGDRTPRQQGIIKLVLYFIRNIVMIALPPGMVYPGGDETEISRSTTIDAFEYQEIFHLLLTASSSMGEEFNTEDVVLMEIIYHIVKGVNIEKLFLDEQQMYKQGTSELAKLRAEEAAMLRANKRHAPTRHNRFGGPMWLERENHKKTMVTQKSLSDPSARLTQADESKKWRRPVRKAKDDEGPTDFDMPERLSFGANKTLRRFIEEFLDAGFNPLFEHIRKAISREAERLQDYHYHQFFYLVGWFLEAEAVRRERRTQQRKGVPEDNSFGLVASVLNQEMFIALNRSMEKSYEEKRWQDLSAEMRCFNQILLTTQAMWQSPVDEDQEIAENILSRIFYEETTHDRVANILRTYNNQGLGYLDSCTGLTHTYIRILEKYSQQNVDLQVRSKRRTRKKKAQEGADDMDGSDEEQDAAQAARTLNERKFDFGRFCKRFLAQGCIDAFTEFCKFYKDLDAEQLKRVHRFYHRVAYKMEMSVMLFRVDIIHLLNKMMKGPDALVKVSPMYKEFDQLTVSLFRKLTKKLEERPALFVEMLFSKTHSTAYFIEFGYEKQTITSKPRPAAELEVKGQKEWEEQVAIVVSALLDKNEGDLLEWVKSQLSFVEVERRAWETAHALTSSSEEETERPTPPSIPLKPSSDSIRTALFKNGHLRLLLSLISLQNLAPNDLPETTYIVPSHLTSGRLKESNDLIKASEFSPPIFDDGQSALDFIRRVSAAPAARKRSIFDDGDSEGIDDDEPEEFLFEPGGPTARKPNEALAALKKSRRKRHLDDDDDIVKSRKLTDEQLEARANARREKELEKSRKIKSALYVVDSDEDSDAERDAAFFEKERMLREEVGRNATRGLLSTKTKTRAPPKKSKVVAGFVDDDSEEDVVPFEPSSRSASERLLSDVDSVMGEDEDVDTPLSSSPHIMEGSSKRRRLSDMDSDAASDEEGLNLSSKTAGIQNVTLSDVATAADEDEDEDLPVSRPVRRRQLGAFVDNSDDE